MSVSPVWLSLFDQHLEIPVVPANTQNHATVYLQQASSIPQQDCDDGTQGLEGLL